MTIPTELIGSIPRPLRLIEALVSPILRKRAYNVPRGVGGQGRKGDG